MRIGIDLGGTKTEALALSADGVELARVRIATRPSYEESIVDIQGLVSELETKLGVRGTVGIGMPGSFVRATGRVKNSNSVWLNGRPFQWDISAALGREVRCANDANCLAVSEATDGSGSGFGVVFAAILGTGCGGGVAIRDSVGGVQVHQGRNGLAGEWGHNSLPWPRSDPGWEELPGSQCYCGKRGCLETWISGVGLGQDYARATGSIKTGAEVAAAAAAGDREALAALERLEDRTARGLASVAHVLDPDVIVLGGGLSRLTSLYEHLPRLFEQYGFGGGADTPIVAAKHGDSSGVRGAAWLWPPTDSR